MKGSKASVWITLAVAAAMMLAANGYGAINNAYFNMVGSSAQFQVWGETAVKAAAPCGSNIWTASNGAEGVDSRAAGIEKIKGNVWIVWDGAADGTGTTHICTYLNTDSGQGVRLFMAKPRGSLSLSGANTLCTNPAGAGLVKLVGADSPLPNNVCAAAEGAIFNVAATDIRPEDALFATNRACGVGGNPPLIYGPCNVNFYGTDILEQGTVGTGPPVYGSKTFQPVLFNLSAPGAIDPISKLKLPAAFKVLPIGAGPIIITVNSTDSASGAFGSQVSGVNVFQNINRFVLAKVFDGTFTRTCDILNLQGQTCLPIQVAVREPMSGTYNTFEYNIPNSVEIGTSQEACIGGPAGNGNVPSGSYSCGLVNGSAVTGFSNPLYYTYPNGATRGRAIGTGDEIKAVTNAANPNGIGYAFWGFGNFASYVGTQRYLTVDGVDPLFQTYTNGIYPTCVVPCPGALTFPHLQDGTYPIWSNLRIVTDGVVPAEVQTLYNDLILGDIPDFVPYTVLNVFRSHYTQAGFNPGNGICPGTKESGGDVGGAVFTIQAEKDFCADYNGQLLNFQQ
ncbi:MAG TPA: hypothetical protein VKM93_17020 [Terriglobia bacterium]|nr:hypothetical protein [Terriglobia bacterium]